MYKGCLPVTNTGMQQRANIVLLSLSVFSLLLVKLLLFFVILLLITVEDLAHSTNAESLRSLCTVVTMAMVEVRSTNYFVEGKGIYKTEGKYLHHRITEWWRLEGASSSPTPPAQTRVNLNRLFRMLYRQVLCVCKDTVSTTPLGNLFQYFGV